MKNRSFHAVLTRFGIIAAILATLVLIAPAASATEVIKYAENGTDPVATLSATDPEGDAITWELAGAGGVDNADFEIGEDTGVLTFASSPDFEGQTDRDEDTSAIPAGVKDNIYKVSVTANDGDPLVLTIEVTDEDEPGTVSLDKPQPQVGRSIAAIDFKDPDDGKSDITLAWYSGPAMDGPWTALDDTDKSYTPVVADEGNYLRVLYTYNDKFGDGKTAEAVSDNPVEERTVANAAPDFGTIDDIEVNENVDGVIGEIAATDDDNDDLVYSKADAVGSGEDANDNDKFSISSSGALSLSAELDFEDTGDGGADASNIMDEAPADDEHPYTVAVVATDPSGATGNGTVIVNLKNVNEPPVFTAFAEGTPDTNPATVYINEGDTLNLRADEDGADALAITVVATDDDNTGENDSVVDTVSYTVEGSDDFTAIDGTLATSLTSADFEDTPSYSITIIAISTRGADDDEVKMYTALAVTVTVVDENDEGTVSFTQREPQVGKSLAAVLEDEDAGVTNVEWQWYRLTESDVTLPATDGSADCPAADAEDPVATASCVLDGATSASYTPTANDAGRYLAARATYNDKHNESADEKEMFFGTTESTVEEEDFANEAPVFQDADRNTPGMQDETVTREVEENTPDGENIGADAFEATDAGDLLMFELGGADADSFGLSKPATDGNSVHLQTKAALDYETKSEYTVTITAMDATGAPDTITVTVIVTDVNEGADIEGDDAVMYAENGEDAVATFTATDPEGDAITWELVADYVDNADFEIGEDTGVLTFASSPDFEGQTDRDEDASVIPAGVKDNMYKVSIKANGGDAFDVTVEVEDGDEPGTVSLDKPQPQVGRSIAATGFDDPDGTDEKSVAWSSGPTDTGPWTGLDVTNESYRPEAADEGNYLRVVYTYNDKFGDGKTAEAVSDNPVEERTVSNSAPDFGTIDDIEVSENVDGVIGEIAATDDDNDDLLYSLADEAATNDNDRFSISSSGALSLSAELDFEDTGDGGADASNIQDDTPTAGEHPYTVAVVATDPSGATGEGAVMVILKDVNETPEFTAFDEDDNPLTNPATVFINEVTTEVTDLNLRADEDGDSPQAITVAATDDDGDADTISYTVEGSDDFDVNPSNELTTSLASADFEDTPSYSITVIAASTRGTGDDEVKMYAALAVTVTVVDRDDEGEVSFTQRKPQVGKSLAAVLEDEDAGVTNVEWQWYRLLPDITTIDAADGLPTVECPAADAVDPVGTENCAIADATSASYTPTDDDLHADGRYLAARATYNDKHNEDVTKEVFFGTTESAVEVENLANNAPVFQDADRNTPGMQDEMVTREVKENTEDGENIGDAFEAQDVGDLLMFELGGADADSFGLSKPAPDTNLVYLQTKADLDFETKSEYTVTITAKDSTGATDTITVTVMVTDVDEGATITIGPAENTAPAFADDAETDFMVYENMEAGAAVGTVTATDEGDTLTYSDDSVYFDVDGDGNITTTMMLDHEAMASHMVTITATDSEGASDSIDVRVNVGDMHPDCPVADDVGLTNDCEALLDAKGDLGGNLNWDADTAMDVWEGVRMSDGRVSGIWLKDEGLDGSVSAALGRLDMLTVLNLHTNSLSGSIPDLSGASMLEELYLPNNMLTGPIPTWLNGSTNLTNLWLWGNQLTGGIPDLSALTSLDKLKLAGNMLDGNINAMYLPPNVTWLIIDSNGFDGVIPDLSGLTSLKLLWLHTNEFTGSVPDGTMLPASLDDLNLRDNMLMGRIPDLTALVNLTRLRLHNNSLSGAVPGSLGGLQSLKQLWLHNGTDDDGMLIGNNMFTSIEDGVGGLANTLIEIQLGGNRWADDACVPAALADVAKNDYEAAGIAVCGADDGS